MSVWETGTGARPHARLNITAEFPHCAHFSFDLLGPHKGLLDLTECAHVHGFRKHLLTEFTVYLKIENAHFLAPQIVLQALARWLQQPASQAQPARTVPPRA